ncbi:MAG TPA: type IV secretion system DNA-binding domain-containing protein, partial [Urbifossiella sp.]|nr:type IV secretion system DNA-binding domain-containing protein [Urbifossiella sp.]
MSVFLGTDRSTGRRVRLPADSWRTHYHLIGSTGTGKTTAIEALLHQLLVEPRSPACHFIIDRMGSFSYSLLCWFASPWCPAWVRERLIYVEGANERVVMPFNPLLFDTPAHGYYKVGRATDCILRAWASQNIEETPRLARWIFNAFWS